MPKNAYFARYPSTNNISIVPTVSFCPPPKHTGTEQIADPNTSSPTSPRLNCEQLKPVNDTIGEPSASPCRSNRDQQNLQVMSSNTSTSTRVSDNFRNSLCVIRDTTSTKAPAFNMSQSIKDLSTSKYKSRNTLVDLTGFNLLKRERGSTSSLPKRKDLRQIDDTKIEQDKMKTNYDENKHRDYSESDSYKTDNISTSTSEKPTSTHSEGNTENLVNGEPKENKTDMEDKMKKYFRQLWKCKFDKLKDKTAKEKGAAKKKGAAKEKDGRAIKSSSKTRQDFKDSKQKSSRSKAILQKVPKTNSTKELRNKLIDNPKNYHDLERRFAAKYPKMSKSETNSRPSPDLKVSIRDRKVDLSPDSNTRCKDFQSFIRYNDDHEIKHKIGNQIKPENLSRQKIPLKSCETTTNKPVTKKKVDDKQSIKTEKRSKVNTNQTNLERVDTYTDMERAIDQSNTDRVKLIKSVERVDKNINNNLSQCTPSGVQDLRSKLSRKRAISEYFVNYREPMENRLDQESLMITVKQDVKADSKNSPILDKPPTVNKPKHKTSKKIKLIINIECPNSDSDNSVQYFNECCSSPEDFSFLDDFNIDEIVHSLNNSQVEPNKTITTDNDYKNNEQIITKEALINHANMKAINITRKEEISSHKGQVIEINSDTDVNINIEIGSVANTKKCKAEQNMEENSKVDRNTKQEANKITDLTGNGHEENAPKEIMDLCKDEQKIKTNSKVDRNTKQDANYESDLNGKHCDKNAPLATINLSDDSNDSVVEVIDITDDNEHYMTSKHLQPKKPIQTSTLAKKVNLSKSKLQLLNKSNKPSVNRRIENVNKECHNTQHEEKTLSITIEQKSDPTNIRKKKQSQLQKSEDPVEASLQAMFNIGQNKSSQLQKSEDPIEASLQAMFNIGQKKSVNSIAIKTDVIKEINTLDKQIKENNDIFHNSEDTVEASLETILNNNKQNGNIRKHIKQNKINGCDKKAKKISIQKSVVEVSLESIFNGTRHKDTGINMDIEQPSSSGQHLRKEIDVLQTAQTIIKVPLETMKNIMDQKKNLNDIKIEPSNITDKNIKKIESESQKPIQQTLPETTKNGIEQNAEVEINSKPLNVYDIKTKYRSQKIGSISKMSLETEENILEKANNKIDTIPLCKSSKKRLQTFEDTGKKPKDKPINKIEKKTNNVISLPLSKNELPLYSGNSTKGTLETAKPFTENCPSSSQIDIKPQNSLGQNNKLKGEPLQKSVETIKTSSKATIDNGEQNISNRSESNKSDKNIQENTLLPLENSVVKSGMSPERSNIEHKTNVTTSVELTIPEKNIEVTSRNTSISIAENSITANNREPTLTSKKSNEENQTKSETVKNNTQKLETTVDALSDLNKITIKDSELCKRSEIATNTKTKQEQVVSNKSLVPDGSNNKKSRKKAEIFTRMQPFLSKLESRMSEYLHKKYTFSSVIHNGRFSTIYKCTTKGEMYAVKVVNQRHTGMFMEGMLFLLQQHRSREDSFILYLINGFEVQDHWCLLTEYYPTNLKQALHGYTHGFHIDQVQILSRQLVDAVNMLKNAGVIHSDIKPSHILLNTAHDRLKLCGFDRSNYSSYMNITPLSGTSSYRAPEVILGFREYHRIDVWSTALVMFEMATNKTLLTAGPNNVILYQQLCTFGSLDWSMLEQSRFRALHFFGTSFIRKYNYKKAEKTIVINYLQRNENLRTTLFKSYEQQWARCSTKWQITKDLDKLESLHKLLEQMLVMDPRNRLRIQFVGASEFMNPHQFRIA